MVYVWYPTAPKRKLEPGIYLPGAKQIDSAPGFDRTRAGRTWPLIVSGAITSHAREGAPLAPRPLRFPLILFSPGNGTSSFTYTTAIEHLVSHGYVVASFEHPYSSSAVVFPNGRVIQFADRRTLLGNRPSGVPYFEGVQLGMADMRQANEVQAADWSFALDRLVAIDQSDTSSVLYRRLDFGNVGAVGHSLGGMTAIRACQRDERIKACVNQDGGTADGIFLQYPDARPLTQPFSFIEATRLSTFTDMTDQQLAERGVTRSAWTKYVDGILATRDRQFHSSRAGSYHIELFAAGMNHGSFGDTTLSATTSDATQRALHNLMLTIDVTRAFLDKFLKGDRRTLLDATGTAEVRITKYVGR
jgi:pimeloyl-ACP methyl ester carboxylesterase